MQAGKQFDLVIDSSLFNTEAELVVRDLCVCLSAMTLLFATRNGRIRISGEN